MGDNKPDKMKCEKACHTMHVEVQEEHYSKNMKFEANRTYQNTLQYLVATRTDTPTYPIANKAEKQNLLVE
jgi:hypothetical protein